MNRTDNAVRVAGMQALIDKLGYVDAERFVSMISRENFDYSEWRRDNLDESMSIRELSRQATEFARQLNNN